MTDWHSTSDSEYISRFSSARCNSSKFRRKIKLNGNTYDPSVTARGNSWSVTRITVVKTSFRHLHCSRRNSPFGCFVSIPSSNPLVYLSMWPLCARGTHCLITPVQFLCRLRRHGSWKEWANSILFSNPAWISSFRFWTAFNMYRYWKKLPLRFPSNLLSRRTM